MLLSWFPCALLVTDEKDSSESLWPCITKWTLMELNFLTTLMNVFHGFFLLECSNDFKRIMQIWACAVKLFENVQNLLAFSHSMVNQKFKSQNLTNWSIPLTDWSIPLTTLSTSTSFKIQIQIGREQFCLTVCWRSWQHDTDFRGCEVGL